MVKKLIIISDDHLKLSVLDTGIGITEENLQNLFQEFGKLEDKLKLNDKGVGLGLLISNKLAYSLSGNYELGLQVESEINKGTKFWFFVQNFDISSERSQISLS